MKREAEKKYHYTILYCDIDRDLKFIDDFKKRKDCTLIKMDYRGNKNPLLYALRRLHTSFRLNQKIKLPFRHVWYDFLHRKFDNPDNEIVITFATVFYKYDADVFFKAWNKKGIKTYVVFIDSMSSKTYIGETICPTIAQYLPSNHILSFDKNDCDKYGFSYLNECYYSDTNIPKKTKVEYDAYIVARVKPGRVEIINRLYELFQKHGVTSRIDFVAVPQLDKDFYANPGQLNPGIKVLKEHTKYEVAVKRAEKANCIIEIGQSGVNAPTFRYFEAVTMGKKLLTNIPYIKKLNFYNEKYMKITDFNEDSIDFEWIKKREKIKYNYKNDFSPIKMLDIIRKTL